MQDAILFDEICVGFRGSVGGGAVACVAGPLGKNHDGFRHHKYMNGVWASCSHCFV